MSGRTLTNRKGRNRFRSRSLGTAAAALAAGGAQPASATIITATGLSYQAGDTFSLTGGSTESIELFAFTGMMGDLFLGLDSPNAMGGMNSSVDFSVFTSGMVDYLNLMSLGDTVDGTLGFAGTGYLVENDVVDPAWPPGSTGYAGIRFDLGGTTVYGYLEVQFDASGNDFTVLSWAYQDDGTPIVIAEPGAFALVGLGLLGLGLASRWRRPSERSPRPSG